MITDSKTQNRLYADTDTVLFSLESRKAATDRMMEILKDTPEFLQVMNHVPAHAMEDGNAGWWDSEYAGSVISSLMETLDSYTPEGYRFGPQSGTMDFYGYWKSGIGKNVLYHVHYTLQTGYEWGKGLPHDRTEAFYREISGLFRKYGFTVRKEGKYTPATYIVKGKTRLHVHLMEISGYCEALHIPEITRILAGNGDTFRLVRDSILEEVYTFTEEEELEYYRNRYGKHILDDIRNAFRCREKGKEEILSLMASRINSATTSHLYGTWHGSPAYRFIQEAYEKLVQKGELIETTRRIGCCNIIFTTLKTNAI